MTLNDEPCLFCPQLLDHPFDAFGDVAPGGVLVRPKIHRFAVFGQRLQGGKRSIAPVDIANDDRDHPRLARDMTFQSPLQFDIVTIVRGQNRVYPCSSVYQP